MMVFLLRFSGVFAGILALGGLLSACSPPPPYILNAYEFNRKSPNFNKEPEDRTSLTVCYSSRNTTPKQIRDMAKTECAKFGKEARLTGQSLLTCPTFTPSGADFACIDPNAPSTRTTSGGYRAQPPGKGAYSWSYTGPSSELEKLLPSPVDPQ